MTVEALDHAKPRAARPQTLKRGREAAAHDQWVREKVAASLADPRPNVAHRQVMDEIRGLIDSKRKQQHAKAAS
jgi:hypothetical protein